MKKTLFLLVFFVGLLVTAFFLAPPSVALAVVGSRFVKNQICYNSQRYLGDNVERSVRFYSGNYRIRSRVQNFDSKPHVIKIHVWTAGEMLEEVFTGFITNPYYIKPYSFVDINVTKSLIIGNGTSLRLYDGGAQPTATHGVYLQTDRWGVGYKDIAPCSR